MSFERASVGVIKFDVLVELASGGKYCLTGWGIAEPFPPVLRLFVVKPFVAGSEEFVRSCTAFERADIGLKILKNMTPITERIRKLLCL